jgi:signal transduction histidine kinase
MRERVALEGGRLEIEHLTPGTLVVAQLPLRRVPQS